MNSHTGCIYWAFLHCVYALWQPGQWGQVEWLILYGAFWPPFFICILEFFASTDEYSHWLHLLGFSPLFKQINALYGNPVSGGQAGAHLIWRMLTALFSPGPVMTPPPSTVYDMAHQMCQGFDQADPKTDQKKCCWTVGFNAEKKRNTKLLYMDDPELLICKTNACRHARREKNATMLKEGGQRTNLDIRAHSGTVFPHYLHSTSKLCCQMYIVRTFCAPILSMCRFYPWKYLSFITFAPE